MATASPAPNPPRLLDRVRDRIRVLHCSIRTEQVYVNWARRFIVCHGKWHPREKVVAAKTARRLPVVLTQREVRELLLQLDVTMWLVALPRCVPD